MKWLWAWLFVILVSNSIIASDLSPEEYFGESYQEALVFYKSNSRIFNSFFSKWNINADLAISVVFPEILRYNRFRDFLETSALELAYISGGKEMADFSIGRFQMKPSFVEMLEEETLNSQELKVKLSEVFTYPSSFTEPDKRRERVERLKQQEWQLLYLACFISLTENRFKKEIEANDSDRLLILSSAYNLGLRASYSDLIKISQLKTFPYGNLSMGRFSYFDVASYFYQNLTFQTQKKQL